MEQRSLFESHEMAVRVTAEILGAKIVTDFNDDLLTGKTLPSIEKARASLAGKFLLKHVFPMPSKSTNHLCWFVDCIFLWDQFLSFSGMEPECTKEFFAKCMRVIYPDSRIRMFGDKSQFINVRWFEHEIETRDLLIFDSYVPRENAENKTIKIDSKGPWERKCKKCQSAFETRNKHMYFCREKCIRDFYKI